MKKINDKENMICDNEEVVSRFLQREAYPESENTWFTPRLMNRLPRKENVPLGRTVMTVVTILSVIICFISLWIVTPQYFPLGGTNHFSLDLLYIHIALASAVILVTLQVIRLIKTYF